VYVSECVAVCCSVLQGCRRRKEDAGDCVYVSECPSLFSSHTDSLSLSFSLPFSYPRRGAEGRGVEDGRRTHATAVCCSVLQCVAVCCSVLQLQCVAVCCCVLQGCRRRKEDTRNFPPRVRHTQLPSMSDMEGFPPRVTSLQVALHVCTQLPS